MESRPSIFWSPSTALLGLIRYPIVMIVGICTLTGYFLNEMNEKRLGIVSYSSSYLDRHLILLYVAWILLSSADTAWNDPKRNWVMTYLQLLIIYLISSKVLRVSRFKLVAWALLLGVIASALLGYWELTIAWAGSICGVSGNANEFALYSLCAMAMVPFILKASTRLWQQVLVVALSSPLAIMVVASGSRTGILAGILLLSLWLLTLVRTGSNWLNLLLILLIILVAGVSAFHIEKNFWSEKTQEITSGIIEGSGTMGERYNLWEAALTAWWSSPISGIGVGQFGSSLAGREVTLILPEREQNWVVHNSYLTVLAEDGLVGLLLFVSWQIIALRRFYRIWRQGHVIMDRYCALSCFFALAVMMFMALTGSIQYDKLLWSLAGFSLALAEGKRSS